MQETIALLTAYKYFILAPLAIIEGPIIAIIAGFLAAIGIFNPLAVYIVILAGDVVGDSGCYAIGKWGGTKFLEKFGRFIGVTEEKFKKARAYFHFHVHKALVFSKLIHGIGVAGLISAGSLKIPYRKFVSVCFLVSTAQSAFFVVVGILFGHAYLQFSKYLNYFAALTFAVGGIIILLLIFRNFKK